MVEIELKIKEIALQWEKWRHEQLTKKWPDHRYEAVVVRHEQKFAKLIVKNSCIAFIAVKDGTHSLLGSYLTGDIFYAYGYYRPAKWKCGSIFDPEPVSTWGIDGPSRLNS